ncbi:hypothetical protein [Clostridium mediterraneense]|uniref:hypothetical protein n=1 Tax=Clostridium mediterraneense TaxID=1805472 RepID=UPI000829E267|nr:hypothetical protein [Clostridium mediterraneense]
MFLTALNKKEANAFVNLVSEFALADHDINLEEKALIEEACEEMGLADDLLESMSLEEAIALFKNSSAKVKKIVYFELLRLGLVDEDYDMDEVEFLNHVCEELEIARSDRFAFAGYFYKYSDTDRLNTEEAQTDASIIINND